MTHPLDDAYLRLDRAEEHLTDLKREIATFLDAEYCLITERLRIDPEPGVPFQFDLGERDVPRNIRLIPGEIIQGLRDPLDYLVFQLAKNDSGSEQKGTQFPIESTEEGFKGRCKGGWLKGISAAHAAAIAGLQPYNGGQWTRQLRALSNPHKHMRLHVTSRESELVISAEVDPAEGTVTLDDGHFRFAGAKPGVPFTVNMKVQVALIVVFEDGLPVIETLEALKASVTDTIDAFKPEFKV